MIDREVEGGSSPLGQAVPDRKGTLGELADQVRSKTAGPFWITLDVFFRNAQDYELVTGSGILSPQAIGRLYRVDPGSVKYFQLPALHVVKISFPRPVTAGSFEDRDLHGGQQHVPLATLALPDSSPRG
ncbi:MAG: hypothetical protein JWM19_244 [Actinomycetia bacterium]|nr:hypothetical protein [Actinomycetes bacterium]